MAEEFTINQVNAAAKFLEDFTRMIAQIANENIKQSAYRASLRETTERMKAITHDGTQLPLTYKIPADKMKFYNKLMSNLEDYNNSHPDKNINFTVVEQQDGQKVFWADQDDLDLINKIFKETSIENGTYVSEVNADDFNKVMKDKRVAVVSGLTNDEIDYMTNKNWKNDFSFGTVLANHPEEGEPEIVNMAVHIDHFMDGNISTKTEDLFTSLMRVHATMDEQTRKNVQYNRALEDKVFKLDKGDDPMYICSAASGDRFLKVTDEGFTVYRAHNDMGHSELGIIKTVSFDDFKNNTEDYLKELYREFASFSDPVEVTKDNVKYFDDTLENKKVITENDIQSACLYHCRSGKDIKYNEDIKNANGNVTRPKPVDFKEQEKIDRYVKAYGDILEDKLIKTASKNVISQLQDEFIVAGISGQASNVLLGQAMQTLGDKDIINLSDKEIQTIIASSFKTTALSESDMKKLNKVNLAAITKPDVLNQESFYKKAIAETSAFIKRGEKLPQEWNMVAKKFPLNENALNSILTRCEEAATVTLERDIQIMDVSEDAPALVGEERDGGINEYRYNTAMEEEEFDPLIAEFENNESERADKPETPDEPEALDR